MTAGDWSQQTLPGIDDSVLLGDLQASNENDIKGIEVAEGQLIRLHNKRTLVQGMLDTKDVFRHAQELVAGAVEDLPGKHTQLMDLDPETNVASLLESWELVKERVEGTDWSSGTYIDSTSDRY